MYSHDTSTAAVACKNWHPDTTSGTYLPPNTREASYAIPPITFHDINENGCDFCYGLLSRIYFSPFCVVVHDARLRLSVHVY